MVGKEFGPLLSASPISSLTDSCSSVDVGMTHSSSRMGSWSELEFSAKVEWVKSCVHHLVQR